MVSRKAALQTLWKDLCSVYVREQAVNPESKITEFSESLLFENQPCKLSIESTTPSGEGKTASVAQSAKLFIDSSLEIPAGSKISVTRNGKQYDFKRSGIAGVFEYHQEIPLELVKEWA